MAFVAWFTGLPGSGKTTITNRTAELLKKRNIRVIKLHLDEVRKFVTPSPTYTEEERETVYRALAYMAYLLNAQGYNVFIDATANRVRWREAARELIEDFIVVYVKCPLEAAKKRERGRKPGMAPTGIYAKAGKEGANVPGVDVEYEEPQDPEITVDTSSEGAWELSSVIADKIVEIYGGDESGT